MAKRESYKTAMSRLEKIVRQIDSDELDIDQLGDKIREANELIAYLSGKLGKVEEEIGKLLDTGPEDGGEK
ncbi:MAG: exodeoxyribonuclease VII small subunit [Bacteroides sp.]|nr:exodeoxyribonuclease VII small subunit [Bacteroides sp.]